jgi:hypothetical protein
MYNSRIGSDFTRRMQITGYCDPSLPINPKDAVMRPLLELTGDCELALLGAEEPS